MSSVTRRRVRHNPYATSSDCDESKKERSANERRAEKKNDAEKRTAVKKEATAEQEKEKEEEEEEDYYAASKRLPMGPLRGKFLMQSVIDRWERQGSARRERLKWKTGCTCAEDNAMLEESGNLRLWCEYCTGFADKSEEEDSFVASDDDRDCPSADVLRAQLDEIDRTGVFSDRGGAEQQAVVEAASSGEDSRHGNGNESIERNEAKRTNRLSLIESMEQIRGDCELASEGETCCLHCLEHKVSILLRPCNHLVLCVSCTQKHGRKLCSQGTTEFACPKCRQKVSGVEKIFF